MRRLNRKQLMHASAQPRPLEGVLDYDVVALREVVLGNQPQEPADALCELHDARNLRGRARGRDRCVSGVPRPSRPLLLLLGSTGPVATMVVSMAPRVSRAVPHGQPAGRGTFIVSSEDGL